MPQKTYMYDTQWTALLNAINTGDSSAVVTALNTIKNSLDNITNAISNQTITVDLSDINSDNVLNLSNVTGGNITNAFNNLNSTLTPTYQILTLGYFSGYIFRLGKLRIISLYNGAGDQAAVERTLDAIDKPVTNVMIGAWVLIDSNTNTYGSRFLYLDTNGKLYTNSVISRGGFTLVYIAQ